MPHIILITYFATLSGAAGKICLQISLARKMNQSKRKKGKQELISAETSSLMFQSVHSSAENIIISKKYSTITYFILQPHYD